VQFTERAQGIFIVDDYFLVSFVSFVSLTDVPACQEPADLRTVVKTFSRPSEFRERENGASLITIPLMILKNLPSGQIQPTGEPKNHRNFQLVS